MEEQDSGSSAGALSASCDFFRPTSSSPLIRRGNMTTRDMSSSSPARIPVPGASSSLSPRRGLPPPPSQTLPLPLSPVRSLADSLPPQQEEPSDEELVFLGLDGSPSGRGSAVAFGGLAYQTQPLPDQDQTMWALEDDQKLYKVSVR